MTNLKEKYKNLEEVLIAFKAELQALQPRDSESIWWERTMDGIYAHIIDEPKGGGGTNAIAPQEGGKPVEGYNGYFTIKDASSRGETLHYNIRVVDGKTYRLTGTAPYWDSGDSLIELNGKLLSILPKQFNDIDLTTDKFVFLRPVNADKAYLDIGDLVDYRLCESMLIGKLTAVNGKLFIDQIHKQEGIATFSAYLGNFAIRPYYNNREELSGLQIVNMFDETATMDVTIIQETTENPHHVIDSYKIELDKEIYGLSDSYFTLVVKVNNGGIHGSSARIVKGEYPYRQKGTTRYIPIGSYTKEDGIQQVLGAAKGGTSITISRGQAPFAISDVSSGNSAKVEVNAGELIMGNVRTKVEGVHLSAGKYTEIGIIYDVDLENESVIATIGAKPNPTDTTDPEASTQQFFLLGSVMKSEDGVVHITQEHIGDAHVTWYVTCGGVK